jgi:hypothetical protein
MNPAKGTVQCINKTGFRKVEDEVFVEYFSHIVFNVNFQTAYCGQKKKVTAPGNLVRFIL